MLKFSRWTPTLGVFLKWDSQKVLKMAHFVIFRHIGGSGGSKKRLALKFSGSRSSLPKMATLQALCIEKLIFSPKTLQCSIDLTPKHIMGHYYPLFKRMKDERMKNGFFCGQQIPLLSLFSHMFGCQINRTSQCFA